jgi:hypothetical protein
MTGNSISGNNSNFTASAFSPSLNRAIAATNAATIYYTNNQNFTNFVLSNFDLTPIGGSTNVANIVNYINAICWSEKLSKFVAITSNNSAGANTSTVLESPNGITWTAVPHEDVDFPIAYRNAQLGNLFYCEDSELFIYAMDSMVSPITTLFSISKDGHHWKSAKVLAMPMSVANNFSISDIAYSPESKVLIASIRNNNSDYYAGGFFFSVDGGYTWKLKDGLGYGVESLTQNVAYISSLAWSPDHHQFGAAIYNNSTANLPGVAFSPTFIDL